MIAEDSQFSEMMKRTERVVATAFPIESKLYRMSVSDLRWTEVGDHIKNDPGLHKEHKLKEKTLSAKLMGTVLIKELGGKLVNKRTNFVLLTLPHKTNRASYIVNGNEVQTVNQLRLRPGPYTRFTSDDNTETFINAAGGGYRILFNRETKVFRLRSGSTYVYLYPVLKALGIGDVELQHSWGREILTANKKHDKPEQVARLYKAMRRFAEPPKDSAELSASVDAFFRSKTLDPAISKLSLKEAFTNITPKLLLMSSEKALKLANGTVEPDDTEDLAFKSIHSVEDFVPEKLEKAIPGIQYQIRRTMDRKPVISSIMSPATFSDSVIKWFATSEFTRYSNQMNPLDIAGTEDLVTVMGEGGIQSSHAVTDSLRAMHPSQIGVLDPLHSPEGGRIGVTGHLSLGAIKKGNKLYNRLIDAKTGKKRDVSTPEMSDKVISFHDQYDLSVLPPKPISSEVKARAKGAIRIVPAKDVDYIFGEAQDFFSVTTVTIPFMNTNHANRVLMADRHIEQAVPLVNPDKPIVQARFGRGTGYEDFFGKAMGTVSPVNGTVSRVTKRDITIKDKAGQTHKIPLHHNYPLNGGTFLTETSTVNAGQSVNKGESVSTNNFMKDGSMALGKNLKVAFLPYKGYNFEDGVVLSEGAAKKLTSEHKHLIKLDITKDTVVGMNRWLAHFPDEATDVDRSKYTADGIIKKGAKVSDGDVLIPAVERVTPHEEYHYDRLHKSLRNPWRDRSQRWASDFEGTVVDVVKTSRFVKVIVRTEEAMQIGDKVSNRSGAKGIVTAILPDNEMYTDKGGETIDMLFNPAGVPGRVNPGQVFEGAAGKIAKKMGYVYLTDNFDQKGSTLDKVEADLKKAGLSDIEDIHDPVSNKTLKDIYVGDIHVMKLQHQVRKKFSARGAGGGYTMDEQPSKGGSSGSAQNIGAGELFAMLASGSTHFLKDATTLKSQSNPEYWRAMRTGMPLPVPEASFMLDKFTTYMKGAGINVEQEGSALKVLPLTDKDTLKQSNGEITSPHVVRANDLKPEPGGLFDKGVTGGYDGTYWSHIDLGSRIPNPLMERPIMSVTGLKSAQFKALMRGDVFVDKKGALTTDSKSGLPAGEGVASLLSKIDVDRELKKAIREGRTAKKNQLDDLVKKRKYLQALKESGISPLDAYTQSKVAVIPAKFRPVYPLPTGALNVSDPNHGYREVLMVNNQLKALKAQGVDDKNLARVRADLYGAVQGLTGVTEPLTRSGAFKGFIKSIKGTQNKYGLFQGKTVKKPQDLSARSTIIPDPKLGIDQASIPQEMAMTLYKPFVMRSLVNMGWSPGDARDKIEEGGDPMVQKVLEDEMKHRPLYLNRAPTLHKFGMMPFKVTPVPGRAIKINPLIVSGFNADFDGNCISFNTKIYLTITEDLVNSKEIGNIFKEFIMRVTGLTAIHYKQGQVEVSCSIGEFPRIGEPFKDKNGADVYTVPPGVSVLSYDHTTNQPGFFPVSLLTVEQDCPTVLMKTRSKEVEISDNESVAIFDRKTGQIAKVKPVDAIGKLVPVLREVQSYGSYGDTDIGWFYGSLVSDGWKNGGRMVGYAKTEDCKRDRVLKIARRKIHENFTSHVYEGQKGSDKYSDSKKIHINGSEFHDAVFPLTANVVRIKGKRQSLYKIIPKELLLNGTRECLFGVFCGLIDGDGSLSFNLAKKRPQFLASYATSSPFLRDDIGLLCMKLGIRSSVSTVPPRGTSNESYVITFSTPDLYAVRSELSFTGEKEKAKWAEFLENPPVKDDNDIIPLSEKESLAISKIARAHGDNSAYVSTRRERATRAVISRVLAVADPDVLPELRRRCASSVGWEIVKSVTDIGKMEVFDFCVKDTKIFAVNNGLIVYDTMGVHVPVSEEARLESFRKMPSKTLFSARSDELMHVPTKEAILGIYLMTKPEGPTILKGSIPAMMTDFAKKSLKVNSSVKILGKIWTPGQVLVNEAFPPDSKPGNVVLDKNAINSLLLAVAKKHPKKAGNIITKIKDLGNHYVTDIGFSFGLKDLHFDYAKRDVILADAAEKSKRVGFAAAYNEATDKIQKVVNATDSRVVIGGPTSGAFGKGGEVRQMIATPVAVVDHKNKIIPVPIMKSFAEGLDITSYLAVIPGARKGLADKGLKTQDTGALSKKLINTTIEEVISMLDCGTRNGVEMSPKNKEAVDRVIADGAYKGRTLSAMLQRTIISRKVTKLKMRSPLTCEAVAGTCAKCFGLLENGQFPPIGYHIGVLAGQSIGEPLTQLTLRAFHTGGAIGGKSVGFDRVKQILEMPENVPGRSIIAQADGKVTSIKPSAAGGWFVGVGASEQFVPKERGLAVKKGQMVKAGDQISATGVIRPQDLLSATGDIKRVRNRIVDDLSDEFALGGVRIKKRLLETAVRPMTNRAIITDAGDGERYKVYRGDVVNVNKLNEYNRRLKATGKRPIEYESTLLSIRVSPYHGGDFVGKLMFERPHETMRDAPGLGATADIKTGHPITQYVFGKHFGQQQQKRAK